MVGQEEHFHYDTTKKPLGMGLEGNKKSPILNSRTPIIIRPKRGKNRERLKLSCYKIPNCVGSEAGSQELHKGMKPSAQKYDGFSPFLSENSRLVGLGGEELAKKSD